MRIRCIENYVLTTGNYTLDNPIRRFSEIFEELFEIYKVIPIEKLNEIRLLSYPTGERGRRIRIIA